MKKKPATSFGERARFRKTDADAFEATAQSIDAFSKRLDAAVTVAQALKPAVGEALQASLQRPDASVAAGYAVVQDPGLAGIASRLETRVKEDLDLRRDPINGAPFRCPDAMIRESAKSIAQQIRGLPELKQRPQVADFTDLNTVIVELPLRLIRTISHGVGTPGSLSGDDFVGLAFSIVLEILLVGAVCSKEVEPLVDRRVRAARQAFDRLPDAELGVFVHLLGAPDDRIRPLFSLIDRYRWRVWPWDLVVVAYGTGNPQLDQLGHVLAILTALGWTRRCHLIPKSMVRWVAWWRWPEMKSARLREAYRIDLAAFDELKLAELCSRMRGLPTPPIIDLESEPAVDGSQRSSGGSADVDGKRGAGSKTVIDADFEEAVD